MRILSLISIFTHGLPSNTRGLCKEIYLQGNKCFEKRCILNTNKKKKKKKKVSKILDSQINLFSITIFILSFC